MYINVENSQKFVDREISITIPSVQFLNAKPNFESVARWSKNREASVLDTFSKSEKKDRFHLHSLLLMGS